MLMVAVVGTTPSYGAARALGVKLRSTARVRLKAAPQVVLPQGAALCSVPLHGRTHPAAAGREGRRRRRTWQNLLPRMALMSEDLPALNSPTTTTEKSRERFSLGARARRRPALRAGPPPPARPSRLSSPRRGGCGGGVKERGTLEVEEEGDVAVLGVQVREQLADPAHKGARRVSRRGGRSLGPPGGRTGRAPPPLPILIGQVSSLPSY